MHSQLLTRGRHMAIEPVHMGESGPRLAALHKGLLYLIRNQRNMTDGMRAAFEAQLKHDRIPDRFGTATASIVGIFQAQSVSRVRSQTKNTPNPVPTKFGGIPMLSRGDAATGNGDVDDLTAEGLNWLVTETRGPQKNSKTENPPKYLPFGVLAHGDGGPAPFPLKQD